MRTLTLPLIALTIGYVALAANLASAGNYNFGTTNNNNGTPYPRTVMVSNQQHNHNQHFGATAATSSIDSHGNVQTNYYYSNNHRTTFHSNQNAHVWHSTSHLDWQPAHFCERGNRYQYVPSHYVVQHSGNWDHLHNHP